MAILVLGCPHCGAERMTFRVAGGAPNRGYGDAPMVSIFAECLSCFHPVCVEALSVNAGAIQSNVAQLLGNAMNSQNDMLNSGFVLKEMWPPARTPQIPDALPGEVQRAFLQAEKNFFSLDCEEAAATMYRRSLDLGLKIAYPEYKGDLNKRIENLVEQHVLPSSIGDWAHQVRLVGNDGAHDLDGVTKADLVACRNFVDAVLRYTFSFPKMVADRRADPAAASPIEV